MAYNSQYNEEEVIEDYFGKDHIGSYVDIGAGPPVLINNFYHFYQKGWRGVNVEPLPYFHDYAEIVKPEDLNLNIAISNVEGEFSFYEIVGAPVLSTFSREIMEHHVKTRGYKIKETKVQARIFSNVIEEYNIAAPDVLNIDVEGHEREVILSIPFQKWKPRMLLIESTYPNTPKLPTFDQWEDLIIDAGYRFYLEKGVNRFYIL